MSDELSDDQKKEYRAYLWGYFIQHAEQRLKSFKFYLILSAILIGAFANISKGGNIHELSSVVLFVLAIVSYIFCKLAQRTRQMIKNAENGIKYIDESVLSEKFTKKIPIGIFSYDDHCAAKRKEMSKICICKAHFSYSECFNWLFFIFGVGGVLGGVMALVMGQ